MGRCGAGVVLANLIVLFSGLTGLRAAITNAAEVRALPAEQARHEIPVHLRGVVTWVNLIHGELFVQDGSAGIFVFIRNSVTDAPLRFGSVVDLKGVTAAGDFSSSVTRATIHVVSQPRGTAKMPKAPVLPFARIRSGEQDSQWGHLEGIIRSGRSDKGVVYLNAVTQGGTFLVIMNHFREDWRARLVGSKVSLEGVLAAVFNEHRQASGVRIFVPDPAFIRIDRPPLSEPFALPQSSIHSIGAFHPSHDWSQRIRIRATVTATSGTALYLSDGGANLAILRDGLCDADFKPGSIVDAVGFSGDVDGRPGLLNPDCRLVTQGQAIAPAEMVARDVLPRQSAGTGSGLAIATGTRNDLRLITLTGTIIQVARGEHSQSLTVASPEQDFIVTLPDAVQEMQSGASLGAKVKVTGVCLISYDEYHRAQSFRLLARQLSDVVVLERASWLTINRALWIITPMALLVPCGLVWISVLRRHVALKTNELRAANARLEKAVVEDSLTGAFNRRHFDEMLDARIAESFRASTPISLMMIDIDYFKAVNDLYGHQVGDRCLVQVVSALRRALSPGSDAVLSESSSSEPLVARYGGEEFAVILPNAGQDAASAIAEEMRSFVQDLSIPHKASPFRQTLTVSLGVATMSPAYPGSAADLIGLADRALYQAKQSGRNRVAASRDKRVQGSSLAIQTGGERAVVA